MIRPTMSHAINKDELCELIGEYASYLEEQLAKANERVNKLNAMVSDLELVCAIGGDKQWRGKLNKFAIEKKIEGVNQFCATLSTWEDVHPIGANYVTSLSAHRDSFNEQLREEQE